MYFVIRISFVIISNLESSAELAIVSMPFEIFYLLIRIDDRSSLLNKML